MFRLNLIAEIQDADNEADAQHKLDAFREAVQPSNEYGILIYRPDQLAIDALLDTVDRVANDIQGYLDGDWDGVDGFIALVAALRRDSAPLREEAVEGGAQ